MGGVSGDDVPRDELGRPARGGFLETNPSPVKYAASLLGLSTSQVRLPYIWGYWKQHELPNFCPKNFVELSYQARRALRRMRRRPSLVRSFWRQAQLF